MDATKQGSLAPCLVVQRLTIGSVPPSEGTTKRLVSAPEVEAIRCVYGVGDEPTEVPAGSCFRPVYAISIPVARLGGLDDDDVYEFDGASMLTTLQERAKLRRWAMRLEFDIIQTHESATSAELYVQAPAGVSMMRAELSGMEWLTGTNCTRKGPASTTSGRGLTTRIGSVGSPASSIFNAAIAAVKARA